VTPTSWSVGELGVRVDVVGTSQSVPADAATFGTVLSGVVNQRDGWAEPPDGHVLTGEVDLVVYDVPRSADVALVLGVRLRGVDGVLQFETEVRARASGDVWEAAPDEQVAAVVEQVAVQLEWLGGIASDNDVILRDAIAHADGDVYAAALSAIERPVSDADTRVLIERLVALSAVDYVRTVGALAQIGDASAVSPIIDALDLDDAETVLAVLPALARFDGAEATGFMAALASGHDDARVRLQATRALERMRL
jgi:hypothetical protein